jgi:hypothetical protein
LSKNKKKKAGNLSIPASRNSKIAGIYGAPRAVIPTVPPMAFVVAAKWNLRIIEIP